MWRLGTWFSGEHVCVGLIDGLDALRAISNLKNAMIQMKRNRNYPLLQLCGLKFGTLSHVPDVQFGWG